MSLYRTPREIEDEQIRLAWIITAVNTATEDLTSWLLAERLDLHHDECERLVNQMYDGLYRSLNTPQDMARAVLWLVSLRASRRADEIAAAPALLPVAAAAAAPLPMVSARPSWWRRLTGRA